MAKKKVSKKKANGKKQDVASILAQDPNEGFEEADSTSYAIPFLIVLQKLSPAVDKDESTYVKGAKPGMIMNTVTKDLYETVTVVPVHYRKTFIEWVLRENGGGFRGENDPAVGRELQSTCSVNDKNQFILPNGNQLSEAANHYVLVEGEAGWEPVLISMSSTQLKASRQWMTQMKQATVATPNGMQKASMFAYRWTLGTESQSNDKGKWFGWTLERDEQVDTIELVTDARITREAVAMNRITYDRTQAEENAL